MLFRLSSSQASSGGTQDAAVSTRRSTRDGRRNKYINGLAALIALHLKTSLFSSGYIRSSRNSLSQRGKETEHHMAQDSDDVVNRHSAVH